MRRLPAIDIHRGVIVILMVMHHTVDAWIRDGDRHGDLYVWLRHLGGFPAPGFMFLAGLSGALVLARERQKGVSASKRVEAGVRRGLYVLGIAFAFRFVSFVAGGNPLANWQMMFRVDILNCMGVSLALIAVASAWAKNAGNSAVLVTLLGLAFLLPAPFVFGHAVRIPSDLAGNYVAGTGNLVLFPLFPWLAFAAFGFAVGEGLAVRLSRREDDSQIRRWARWVGLAGALAIFAGWGLWRVPVTVYGPHDYWKASPLYMLIRLGIQLMLLWASTEIGTRLSAAGNAKDPIQLLGRHSLAIYLVHVEVVYGPISGPLHGRFGVFAALGLMVVVNAGGWLLAWAIERRERREKPRSAPLPAPAEPPIA